MDVFEREPAETGVVYTGRWLRAEWPAVVRTSAEDPLAQRRHSWRAAPKGDVRSADLCRRHGRNASTASGVFDETLPTSNDYDLWIRMSRQFRFKYIPQPLAIVHASTGSISTDPAKIIAARKLLLQKHADEFAGAGRGIAAYFLWQIGSLLLLQGNAAEGRRYLMRAYRSRPWNAGYGASLLLSLAGPGVCTAGACSAASSHEASSAVPAACHRAMTTRLLFVSFNLAGGGAERVLVNLSRGPRQPGEFQSTCLFYDSAHDYPCQPASPSTRWVCRVRPIAAGESSGWPRSSMRSNPDVVFSFLTGVNLEVDSRAPRERKPRRR